MCDLEITAERSNKVIGHGGLINNNVGILSVANSKLLANLTPFGRNAHALQPTDRLMTMAKTTVNMQIWT